MIILLKRLWVLYLFFYTKNDIFDNYFDNLYYNQQKLVTPYDIFFFFVLSYRC
jgi:hypothetical protein